MKHLFSALRNRFFRSIRTERLPESGNTGVIAPNPLLNLKGLDPGKTGATSGSTHMSKQFLTGATPLNIKRQAAKAAAMFTAVALIVALTVPAIGTSVSRASADHAPLEAIFGTVVEVTAPGSITVATDSGVRTIIVPNNDVFTGDINAVEDIAEGDRVVGSVHVDFDGTTTADKLLIVPDLSKSVTQHILGVILEQQDGAIVVQDRSGNTITIDVSSSITVPPVGTVVTAVAQLDRATGRLTAQAFDRVGDAVQRIQEAKDRVNDSDLKEELEERLERARDQHLSALERARQGLERAQQAVSAAIAERDEAQRRLTEVQARFDDLRQRYVQEASDRNERLPELRTEGTLNYDDAEWLESSGTFSLTPRINDSDDSVSRNFSWNERTLAIVPVELRQPDPSSPAITATTARSIALPLNDVKSLIPSGSQVIVQYDPNTEPALATLVTIIPPRLSDAIKDALERERLRSINGFITLVEETPDLNTVIGVIVVANREHDVKVAAKVSAETEIEVDGEPARFGQLAAGMSVEVEFAEATAEPVLDAATALTGRLNALQIRARSTVDDDEVHVAGLIAGLDPDTRTVGILTRDGEVVRAQVVDDAVIVKDGTQSRFSALEVGDLVLEATRFNRGTLILTRLVVQSPRAVTFSGAITGLDRNPERLTISTSNGRVLVAFIIDSTQIRTEDGKRLTFSDLSVGNRIIKGEARPVQRDGDTVLVATELVIGGSNISTARGVVSRVAADSGKLRIETRADSSGTGSAHIDLTVAENNRSVLFKNDVRIKTLAPVRPGDIVESVSYVTSTGIIVKMSVVSPNLHRLRGRVSAVASSGITVEASSGLTVGLGVTDETVLTLNGRRLNSLRLVDAGDIVVEAVYIAGADTPARGVALSITLISPLPVPGESLTPSNPDGSEPSESAVETTISGVITKISGSKWEIGDQEFHVTSDTRFFGERPRKGLVAKATLVSERGGDFVAISISVAGRPDTNPTTRPVEIQPVQPGDTADLVRILGKVQDLERGRDGNVAVVVVDGVNIVLLSNTIIVGEPKVGSRALAVVRRTPGGAVVANSIIFIKTDDSGSDDDDDQPGDISSGSGSVPVTEPKLTEDHDDPNVPKEDADNSGSNDSSADGLKIETITVERISGRIVLADGDLYLLKSAQARDLGIGDIVTVRVRKIDGDQVNTELSFVDRLAVNNNPLYAENNTDGDNPLYVAE